jgi:hypothetical protein
MKRALLAASVWWLAVGCSDDDVSDGRGDGGSAVVVTDIFKSPECMALCQRLETTCKGYTCDPMSACEEDGECLAEQRFMLACKADPQRAELTCQPMGGYGLVATCFIPKNICR